MIPAVAELSTSGWLKITTTKGGSKTNTNNFVIDIKRRVPVKQTSPVKQNAEGVKYTAHEPSTNLSPLRGEMGVSVPPACAPDGARCEEKYNSTALAEYFESLCTIWRKPDGINMPAAWKAFQAVCDDHPPELVLASAQRWVAATVPRYLKRLEVWLGNGAWKHKPPSRTGGSARGKENLG